MEHCVFCAFLSKGTDFTNCGRPCESYDVKVRDRTGTEHLLRADAGCRNTVFNGVVQSGAEWVQCLFNLGVRYFRIEFVNEPTGFTQSTIDAYQKLLTGKMNSKQLWQNLKTRSQIGVTRGTAKK
jgi:putative protease